MSRQAAHPAAGDRIALVVVQLGALAVVLASLPYKAFDLDRYFVPKELVLHATALLAATACVLSRRRFSLSIPDLLLAIFLAVSTVSAVFATNWWLAGRALAVSLAGAALFWTGRALSGSAVRGVVLVVGFAVTLAALMSLAQAYGVESTYFSLNRAPGGTFGNRNFVAHICAIGLPVLLYSTLTARRTVGTVVGGVCIGLVVAALVLSRSRAAWLAVAVSLVPLALIGLALFTRWKGQGVGSRAAFIALVTVIAVILAVFLPNTLEWKSDNPYLESVRGVVNYKQGSGHGRLIQYTNSLRMTMSHPVLGVGPGNWAVIYPRYASHDDPSLDSEGMTANPWPSSDLMAYLSERGVLAFAALVLFILALLVDAAGQVRRSRNADQLFRALALGGTIIATMIVGAFDAVLLLAGPALLAWVLFGTLSDSRPGKARQLDGGARAWLALGIVVAGAIAVAHSALQMRAMQLFSTSSRMATLERAATLDPGSYRIHVRVAQANLSRGNCAGVKAHAMSAHELFPNAAEPRQLLGACGVRVRR